MVAMRAATDNANGLVDDLTLVMNKLRQDTITNQLLDLVGGQVALEG
jgi:F-type H+-transporting ATPase subunit gamma